MRTEPTLAELAAATDLQPRTIRSWVTQGLLSGPLNRGPGARYPADTLERILAIRTMRDRLHMPLVSIRQRLLVATPEEIRSLAADAKGLAPEPAEAPLPSPSSALDYIRGLRASPEAKPPEIPPSPSKGIEGLEQSLSRDRAAPARKARAEEWLRISITPDVELAARGPLDPEARARLERCADLIRDILLGRDR